MSEVKQVTPEELNQLKTVRDEIDKYIIELGQIQYQKVLLEVMEGQLKIGIIKSKEAEKKLSSELAAKYGDVQVNIETGIIS